MSPSTSCHPTFNCTRTHIAKRYRDHSAYDGYATDSRALQPERGNAVTFVSSHLSVRLHLLPAPYSRSFSEVCSRTGARNGCGVFVNRHGDRYSGAWQDDKRHGAGEYSWHTGDRYTGEWAQGSMCGSGTFHWKNGDRFTGGWLDGHMHGAGSKTLHNGDVLTGTWQHGRQQGKGSKLFACGDKHTGLYKDDKSVQRSTHPQLAPEPRLLCYNY